MGLAEHGTARGIALVALAVVACSHSGGNASVDASAGVTDGTTTDERAGPTDGTASDAWANSMCRASADCGPDHFCSLPSGTCVSAMTAIATGTTHTCALHKDGRVSCWGYGQFIAPGLPNVTPPVIIDMPEKATAVVVGIQAACALMEGGLVRCWGDFGQGTEAALKVVTEDGKDLTGVTDLAGGSVAFCGLTAAGTYCWGDNKQGEMARPTSMSFPARTAVLAAAGARKLIAATVAVLVHDGGTQLCGWGSNDSGLLPGARGLVPQPVCADNVSGILQLSVGDGHVCARRGGNAFSCWGENSGGQLGIGDENTLEAPLPGTMSTLPADIVTIASGAYHVCALLKTGAVMCWGSNEHGECGSPPTAPLFSPTAMAGTPDPMTSIGAGAGAQHTCGLRADGSAVCWGYDNEGQLGSGVITENADRFSATPLVVRF